MKYLKLFENHFHEVISEAEVAKICSKYRISNWTLNSDGTVDVDGDVFLHSKYLTKLPLNFGRINREFICGNNRLTSLEGCPKYVGGVFNCGNNNLTSLEYCPQYVGTGFNCQDNNIRTFEGIDHIVGVFLCNGNPIWVFWNLFRDASKIETFNEWGVIQDNKVILYRLNDFLQEIGKNDVTEEQLNLIKRYYTVL